jgi:hypothetical protein
MFPFFFAIWLSITEGVQGRIGGLFPGHGGVKAE